MDPLGDSTVPGAGFWSNIGNGIADGWQSTKGFVSSLGAAEGWKKLGTSLLEIQPATNIYHAIKGEDGLFSSATKGTLNYAANVPNMTKDQIGHDLGFALEKTAEAVVATKGVGMVKNAINAAEATELGNTMGTLREASQGTGNFGLGEATAKSSNKLGNIWVGDNAKLASDGKTLVSQDGLKQYRPPAAKNSPFSTTGVQSNFQARPTPSGAWQSNGHLDITPKPWWKPF